jgi:alpha-L-glutamate ligase-like protein
MARASDILGLNARSQLFSYKYNSVKGRSIASSKIRTKRILREHGIPVPEIYALFKSVKKVYKYNWNQLPSSFALKPNGGLGGEGIVIVKRRARDPENKNKSLSGAWVTTSKQKIDIEDLKLHTLDIIEGAYSIKNLPDIAFIEEFIGRHKAFKKFAFRGTPDIRVIVFNKVPVMAMLRLPTRESGGRANLHQGAIGVGIDITTGVTTKSYWKGKYIKFKPESKRKLNGLKIPKWSSVLKIAVETQIATDLGYLGVDIVLHPERGPMVLEINYMPGLEIQMVNQAGLKKRLERVEDLNVRDAEHGVNIAKALFAARFSDRVKAEEGIKTVKVFEKIRIKSKKGKKTIVPAKIDTGAWRTSISQKLAQDLGLLEKDNILWTKTVKSSLGKQERPVINLTFWLAGRKIQTPASVAKRGYLKFPVIIGRKNLKGMNIDADVSAEEKREKLKK